MGRLIDLHAYQRFKATLEKHLAAYRRYPDYHCRRLICKMAALAAEEFGVKRTIFPKQRMAVVNGRIVVPQPGGWYKAKGGPQDAA
jgi:histidinol-phosphate/aromatic aminotransferase/cobyric acid decarboxylase-like protein